MKLRKRVEIYVALFKKNVVFISPNLATSACSLKKGKEKKKGRKIREKGKA